MEKIKQRQLLMDYLKYAYNVAMLTVAAVGVAFLY